MYGWYYAVTDNDAWVKLDDRYNLYRQKTGNLFLGDRITDEETLKYLYDKGFRLVVWTHRKGELVAEGPGNWQDYVEVVEDLGDVLGNPVWGKPRR